MIEKKRDDRGFYLYINIYYDILFIREEWYATF